MPGKTSKTGGAHEITFFELSFQHDFPPLKQVLKTRSLTPDSLHTAAHARLQHLAQLAAVVEREGAGYPRDVMRLFAGEVGLLAGEVEVLLNALSALPGSRFPQN